MAADVVIYDNRGNPIASGQPVDGQTRTDLDQVVAAFKAGLPIGGSVQVNTDNAYARQAWVYSCVTAIARLIASVPFEIRPVGQPRKITDGIIADLFLRRPAKRRSRYELWYATVSHLELTGNAIWLMESFVGDPASPQPPLSLKPLNPRRITPEINKDTGELIGYTYRFGEYGKNSRFLSPDEVIHFKYPNPFNEHWGQAPLEAALQATRTDLKAAAYNEKFFENSAQPGGILMHKRALSTAQKDQVQTQFEQEYGGVNQSHRTAVLAGEWSYHQVGLGQRDMEYLEQRRFSREQIASVFGVPGILINDPNSSNYSTASVEMRLFADSNWLPKVRYIEDVLRSQFFQRFAPQLEGIFNVGEAPGLREATSERIAQTLQLNKAGIPMADLIKHFDLPFRVRDHMKHWWITSNMVPADAETAGEVQTLKVDKTTFNGKAPKKDALPGEKAPMKGAEDQTPKPQVAALTSDISEQRRVYWSGYRVVVDEFSKELEGKFSRYFFEVRQRVLGGFARGSIAKAYDINAETEQLQRLTGKLIGDVVEYAGNMVFEELGVSREFSLQHDVPEERYVQMLEGLSEIPSLLKPRFLRLEDEKSIKSVLDKLSNRSGAMAKMETTRLINEGRFMAMRIQGVERHQWIANRSGGRGFSCSHVNDGEIRDLGEIFSNGLAYPAQASGDYGCCGCVALPVS